MNSQFGRSTSTYSHCQLNDWPTAVRIVLGKKALILYCSAFAVILFPILIVVAHSINAQRPWLQVWAAFGYLGYRASSTTPTGIGIIVSVLLAGLGVIVSIIYRDGLLAVCGIIPGFTWIASCAVLGTTAQYLIDALQSSDSLFEALKQRGILSVSPTDSEK